MNAFDEFYWFAATDMADGAGNIHIILSSLQQPNIHIEDINVSSSIIKSDLYWNGEMAALSCGKISF